MEWPKKQSNNSPIKSNRIICRVDIHTYVIISHLPVFRQCPNFISLKAVRMFSFPCTRHVYHLPSMSISRFLQPSLQSHITVDLREKYWSMQTKQKFECHCRLDRKCSVKSNFNNGQQASLIFLWCCCLLESIFYVKSTDLFFFIKIIMLLYEWQTNVRSMKIGIINNGFYWSIISS